MSGFSLVSTRIMDFTVRMRGQSLVVMGIVLGLGLLRVGGASEAPNIVFILADDLGWADVGANNPDCLYDTPNIDRLARSGMNLVNGYAASQVCSPTRYSILTGKYPARAACTDWFTGGRAGRYRHAEFNSAMPLEEITIAEALKKKGYRTAFVGKWHLGDDEQHWPENQGFDINVGGWSAGGPKGGYFAPFKNPRLGDYPKGAHLPKVLTDESLKIMEEWSGDPFLLYLCYYSVHTPLRGREDLVAKYELRREKVLRDGGAEFAPEEQVWPVEEERKVRVRQTHAVYAAMVEALDEQVGRLLDRLEELDIADNTVVVFTSDNGGLSTAEGHATSNLPLRGGKGWVYEGGIREPFLIRWPGITRPGSICETPVISTDLYPTFLEAAGVAARPEQHLDGVSLVPLLRGGDGLGRDALFWHYPHYSNQGGFPSGAVRMGDWKLVERYEDGRLHLYNLSTDLREQHDLAGDHPERVSEMQERLHAWYEEVDARFLRPLDDGPTPWRPGDEQR